MQSRIGNTIFLQYRLLAGWLAILAVIVAVIVYDRYCWCWTRSKPVQSDEKTRKNKNNECNNKCHNIDKKFYQIIRKRKLKIVNK